MTCAIWLLGYKYFVYFSGRRLFAFGMEKRELRSVMKMIILTNSFVFVTLHTLLFWLRFKNLWMYVSSWITSCEINFCWVTLVLVGKFCRNVCVHNAKYYLRTIGRQTITALTHSQYWSQTIANVLQMVQRDRRLQFTTNNQFSCLSEESSLWSSIISVNCPHDKWNWMQHQSCNLYANILSGQAVHFSIVYALLIADNIDRLPSNQCNVTFVHVLNTFLWKWNSVNCRTYFKVAILLWVYPTKVNNLNTDRWHCSHCW